MTEFAQLLDPSGWAKDERSHAERLRIANEPKMRAEQEARLAEEARIADLQRIALEGLKMVEPVAGPRVVDATFAKITARHSARHNHTLQQDGA